MKKLLCLLLAVLMASSLMLTSLALEGYELRADLSLEDYDYDSWAEDELFDAMDLGLMTDDFGYELKEAVTRAEFCLLAVKVIEVSTDLTIDEVLEAAESLVEIEFTDTEDEGILAAAALGIVGGYGDGIFKPDAGITRQEAAKMLAEPARVLGADITGAEHQAFANDGDKIEAWAVPYVDYVCQNGIMKGTAEGVTFEPTGTYSKQQALITMSRLYQSLSDDEAADDEVVADDEATDEAPDDEAADEEADDEAAE